MSAPWKADEVLAELWAGNRRFQRGEAEGPRRDSRRRTSIAGEQSPRAAVVACSDSRVPPELLFDQGLGDLFVVRLAGNVIDGDALGSLEYAVDHLDVPVIVILGHSRCGAVGAAVRGGNAATHMGGILASLQPAIEATVALPGDPVANAAREHVRRLVAGLAARSPVLRGRMDAETLTVVGAYYDLDTGAVERLEP
ncbi:MAG: carbonic anhydrase [Candidatus Bipolaricaulis sp.]|nr:carbonic anhydrase [Candidatus Bipolaricaulis sp.]MDD5219957.1 carbonic anhydrase [Candidatus Bipolaricaulis sp.]MDD5645955.1 carbonic anhydrase [Candidatus Bipolaricaulis sp.]